MTDLLVESSMFNQTDRSADSRFGHIVAAEVRIFQGISTRPLIVSQDEGLLPTQQSQDTPQPSLSQRVIDQAQTPYARSLLGECGESGDSLPKDVCKKTQLMAKHPSMAVYCLSFYHTFRDL